MKRGKRYLEKDNIFIYLGTAIFFILAIALGIIMYMLNTTASKIENKAGQISQEQQITENSESVSTEIGKTVEEQEKSKNIEGGNTNTSANSNENTSISSGDAGSEKNNKTAQDTANTTTSMNTTTSANSSDSTTSSSKNVVQSEKNENQKNENKSENEAKSKDTEVKKEITFVKPTEGEIICEYAKENLVYSETLKEWITHTAVDIKADKTSVIKSAADGIVRSIVNDPRYGLTVVIEHDDGYQTVYSNLLTAEFVVEGEEVKQGQTIGTAGNSASFESSMECHLHFELLKDGEYLDPTIYLK